MSAAVVHFGVDESCIVGVLADNGYRVRDCEESLVSLTRQITRRELDAIVVTDHGADTSQTIENASVRRKIPLILFEGPRTICHSSNFDLVVPQTAPSRLWLGQIHELIDSARRVRATGMSAVERAAELRQQAANVREQSAMLQQQSVVIQREPAFTPLQGRLAHSRTLDLRCVMVADDHVEWRHTALSILEEHVNASMAVEVSNGRSAVRRAEQLRPDLILMDISMPGLNGIEATRLITQAVPEAAIVFLSFTNEAEITREALRVGARGYVSKIEAASELWPAVQAVLNEKRYVSNSVRPA